MTTDISRLTISDEALKLAESITLADLLESPVTMADTVSLISNILRHGAQYNELKQDEDVQIELTMFRINQLIDSDTRTAIFHHLRDRRS
ncbi:MAG: hypothetical protein ACO3EI_05705 [Candidatus Limnocylindrus sp.]